MVNDIRSAEQRANRRALQQKTPHHDADGEGVDEAEGEGLASQVPTFHAVHLMLEDK